ncbi:MAG: ATP-binding cassette domain-containing protein [Clostridia bacterium]|nr:ATP-binding cassette domain-containing protein [Clostridia bacterium]
MSISVDINKRLGDFSLEISFETDAKRIGILGPSGCGKSITLKSIAGIEKPDSGHIRIDNRVLFDQGQKINLKPQKRRVGYMFQNYALFPTMNVVQNIGAGLGVADEDKSARISDMIERFHLQGLEKHLPGQLSGGQQQRVALARIMAYRPDIILLDEPFSALDEHLKERLQHEMISMLEDYEGQVILVSHNRDEIYRFSEELLIMDDGHVMARGQTERLFGDPGSVAVARMTGCKNFSDAERLDDHRIRLKEWGVTLELEREIPEDIDAIGYRAHAFEPVWGERQKNCLPFRLSGVDELPFERRYYLLPEEGELICWFIQDNERAQMEGKPHPDYLKLREESVMLLRR